MTQDAGAPGELHVRPGAVPEALPEVAVPQPAAAADSIPATGAVHADGTPGGPAGAAATGDPRVDDALSRLAELEALPLADQVDVFTDIHRRLAAVLADPDSRG